MKSAVMDVIKDYGRKSAFASFLPGIAGVRGTPIWCYYVNRGQAVASFGVSDKDHGIMEFYPAHTAYQMVKRTGFRTFIKANGSYYEPFAVENENNKMEIHMNALFLEDYSKELGLRTSVSYTTLPGEEIGALIRKVVIKNESGKSVKIEALDGMPAVIPYGCDQLSIKMMCQTTKAWMQVEDADEKRPYYRVRVSMEDSAIVKKVDGGNFGIGRNGSGGELDVIADPNVVFSYDLSLGCAVGFRDNELSKLLDKKQNFSNELPCCIFAQEKELADGEEITFAELIGQVRNKEVLDKFLKDNEGKIDADYFEKKLAESERLTDELTDAVSTKTADETFDNYCRVNYMDNVLRGGTPIKLADMHSFYVYSRKHGDLERDYNYFSMSPEFYSQGNGNFRDVNQNRRCDTFFSRNVSDDNIRLFYSLLQLDGYNPLKIEQIKYTATEEAIKDIAIDQPFTPGELYFHIGDRKDRDELFYSIMNSAEPTLNADFGEGYWSDHWTYNLDLIEDYLEIYPDREKELLFENEIQSFDAKVKLLPRAKRYEETENGIRQYYYHEERENTDKSASYATDKNGKTITMPLISKLVLLSAVKFSSLDVKGLGIEMDGGKPGWYDALNGLPGLLGSSMNESYELLRMIEFTIAELSKHGLNIELPVECAELIKNLESSEMSFCSSEIKSGDSKSDVQDGAIFATMAEVTNWNSRNDLRESYRSNVYDGLSGHKETLENSTILNILKLFEKRLSNGVKMALEIGDGISPAYFTYEVTDYSKDNDRIHPNAFKLVRVPDFLEGVVRSFKTDLSGDDKKALYDRVKESALYDKKLKMYKVNAPLSDASFELGRCRAFTPGWLENESIWLHMEYKYLLELLRSGLYEEFFDDFRNAAVPFLDKEVYGRSTLENSSFIASSANPNESIHGKGFVARLSGSTIEFISMWKLMFFGRNIFRLDDNSNELIFAPEPALPEYLLRTADGHFEAAATLLGSIPVTYRFMEKKNYYPGNYEIKQMNVALEDGTEVKAGGEIRGELAEKIRSGGVKCIEIDCA